MSKPKLICFYGPESTGKTVLSKLIAKKFQTVVVPEVARELIQSNEFSEEDIVRIGRAQTDRVKSLMNLNSKVLICDTDVITTQIYSLVYLDRVPDELHEFEKEIQYDHYFLFDVDVPWVPDGMRDLQSRRDEIFKLFRNELLIRSIPFTLVRGDYEEREKIVVDKITAILSA